MTPRLRILVVDDDEMIRDTYALFLEDRWDLVMKASPEEAFSFIETGHAVDAVITDFDFKCSFDGTHVATVVRRKYPHIPIIMATGSVLESPRIQAFHAIPNTKLLRKPFLHTVLDEILSAEASSLGGGH